MRQDFPRFQTRDMQTVPQDECVWRKLAQNKWGGAVLALRDGRPTCWAAYAKHRLCLASRKCAFPYILEYVEAR